MRSANQPAIRDRHAPVPGASSSPAALASQIIGYFMTLILTRASRYYILQVADRLVSTLSKEHDRFANKTVLYSGTNGLVAIGYTGLAYVGGKPTDHWIVEQLTGVAYSRQMAMRSGPFDHVDIGRALNRIRDAFDYVPAQIPRALRKYWDETTVFIAGWQWNSQWHYRPILASVAKERADSGFDLEYAERHWYVGTREQVRLWGGPVANVSDQHRVRLRQRMAQVRSRDEAERVLVELIRDIAKKNKSVGQDCMSLLLSPPPLGIVRVRYIPSSRPKAANLKHETSIAFTPWIIGKNLIIAPSLIRGSGWNTQLGFYRVRIEAPEGEKPRVLFQAQPRRGPN
ncbi:MAG: hypothetical protein KAV87_01140 [Desulfobacteraceae bacterium]|nr:hypothetical protein [Desulfobacteraceae bacterium]